jgi:hypothetical protein
LVYDGDGGAVADTATGKSASANKKVVVSRRIGIAPALEAAIVSVPR